MQPAPTNKDLVAAAMQEGLTEPRYALGWIEENYGVKMAALAFEASKRTLEREAGGKKEFLQSIVKPPVFRIVTDEPQKKEVRPVAKEEEGGLARGAKSDMIRKAFDEGLRETDAIIKYCASNGVEGVTAANIAPIKKKLGFVKARGGKSDDGDNGGEEAADDWGKEGGLTTPAATPAVAAATPLAAQAPPSPTDSIPPSKAAGLIKALVAMFGKEEVKKLVDLFG